MKLTNNLYFYPEQGMFDCNTYVVTGSAGIIIDPGNSMFLPALSDSMRKDGIDPKDIKIITNTHLHGDHCGGNEAFKKLSGAEISIHPVQKQHYDLVVVQGARLVGMPVMGFNEDSCLDDARLSTGDADLEMIKCPGHSPDCVSFYLREEKVLICGDVIFSFNTGRVDLPGGSAEELKSSINNLSQLEIDYLLPGHMDIVAGAEKVKQNFSFIRENVFQWL